MIGDKISRNRHKIGLFLIQQGNGFIEVLPVELGP
jgi:hypothetical protein